jgi:hypothetical protein
VDITDDVVALHDLIFASGYDKSSRITTRTYSDELHSRLSVGAVGGEA